MYFKSFLAVLLLLISISIVHAENFKPTYDNAEVSQENSEQQIPKKLSLVERIKKYFIGEPTGFTPEIYDCPYLNTMGPSYMRGFYGSNGWNNHNIYHPYVRGSF